jgi:hypothetical protein
MDIMLLVPAPRRTWKILLVLAASAWSAGGALAQPASTAESGGEGGPVIADSTVGYIDSAIPGNQLRLRFDAGYNSNVPNRGAFFYQRSPESPGDRPETRVDYQEFSAYGEVALNRRFSAFVEVPVRLLNPEIDDNAKGLGDMNFGFKWAFLYEDDNVLTFQLRTYLPTGDGTVGLGTSHVSLEPALLGYHRVNERLSTEGELRLWIPIGDTPFEVGSVSGGSANFASTVVRYGVGVHYDVVRTPRLIVSPVAEVVGWTFLDGKKTIALPSGPGVDQSASGDTIVNLKLGSRFKVPDLGDLYIGYGRALTGERMYRDILRAELRFVF